MVRRSARTGVTRFLGMCLALVLVASACRSGEESATPGSHNEAGTPTSDTGVSRGGESLPDDPIPATRGPALTVEVDPASAPATASTASPSTAEAEPSTATPAPQEDGSAPAAAADGAGDGSDNQSTDGSGGAVSGSGAPARFDTRPPGTGLPTGAQCASWIRSAGDGFEHRPQNASSNDAVPPPAVTGRLVIDGADAERNQRLAPRIDGDFTGTTEQILRWGACKWGFDEDITRARAVAESSWRMSTTGDRTDNAGLCNRIGLSAPCSQSYGLLQVKGTVHEGTYPTSAQATAFGVDYAMAWLRACFEGGFGWLAGTGTGPDYRAGDEWGCIGAWFSGRWWDRSAGDYVGDVRSHLDQRTWESYR